MFDGHAWSKPQVVARHRHLTGISCADVDFCLAPVYEDARRRRNGRHVGCADPIDPAAGHLTKVSCAAPDFCVVLDDRGATITYSGRTWQRQ